MDDVLDMTPRQTADAMNDPEHIAKDDDDLKEMEIRENLKLYEGKRLLTRKYERQLEEHKKKTGDKDRQFKEEFKRRIVASISNG